MSNGYKRDNERSEDIVIFPGYSELHGLNKILSPCSYDDGGIECALMDGYVAIWMKDICEYHGIECSKVFIGENWDS
ncbi:hypothetical protein [Flavivirga spongiicola]|uniref:Uncharacterized protein n=1 Tax=Flavivirga spongiicola TaxID=421621 RepID=A0ABU7XPT0_9FLAO|nr:hypothetical protein [Flavivirga sp. MEBiC05379]MDO5977797.1 hypothetical protein [Flavivirga sp. MEBiC05379]